MFKLIMQFTFVDKTIEELNKLVKANRNKMMNRIKNANDKYTLSVYVEHLNG